MGLGLMTGCVSEAQRQPQITEPPLPPERAHHIEKTANVKIISKEVKKKLVTGPRWRPDIWTDWLAVVR
jgi:hypothetical protein